MTSSVIAAQGPDNSLSFYWQAVGTTTWAAEQVSGLATTNVEYRYSRTTPPK
jgi:hypothetical protein